MEEHVPNEKKKRKPNRKNTLMKETSDKEFKLMVIKMSMKLE